MKAGGLGDVVGALPIALRALGCDARVVMPRYDVIPLDELAMHRAPLGVPLGTGEAWAGVAESRLPKSDVPIYFLDHIALFGRGYLYDPPGSAAYDNLVRFSFLWPRRAPALPVTSAGILDVIHVHDCSRRAPASRSTSTRSHEPTARIAKTASVLTIHNLAHQAKFPARDLATTHIPPSELRPDSLEDTGGVNPLKGGLYHATKLTTVSTRYAEEIRSPSGGAGLEHVIQFRGGDLVGILNGIDERVWNPASDPALAASFDAEHLEGKGACKRALQRELGLAERPDVPLIGVVSRLSQQKGTDAILAALGRILDLDTQVVILGSGDPASEGYLHVRSHYGGDRFRAWIGFNEGIAHRIEAGADLFLMPSRFEPCGLNQMYSQRYGTLPIVRATGGLDDTVENYDPKTGAGTGFKLWDLSVESLIATVAWAVDTYRTRPDHFRAMQVRAMQKQFGWGVAARAYRDVYGWAVSSSRGRGQVAYTR